MSTYSRVKTWSSNETLTSADLNTEFNNIITNTNSGALNSDNVSTSAAWTWTGTHTMSTSSKLAFVDNIYLTMGSATDGDYLLRYSASSTALELSTTNSDGSGTNAVVVDIQDGTDDVRVRGGFSTDNNTAPTTGIKVGGNVLSDTDSTDDLGTTSVRWANVYTDAVGDSGQTLGVKATTLSFDAASTIDTSGNNALTLDAGSAVLTLDGGTLESDATTLSFDAAATIDTSGNNNLTLSAGTGTLVATAGDMTLFDDNNNADVSLSLGTSATEALVVEAFNGGSNKTLEELRFTTKTASGTAQHGKMSFYVDEVNIGNINDDGITLESGKVLTGNVTGNASGTAATVTSGTQAAITTCANLTTVGTVTTGTWSGVIDGSATMTLEDDATGDIYYRDASGFLERLASGADGYVLTGTGAESIPAWEAVSAGVSLSGDVNNTIATVTGANALIGEATLKYTGSLLTAEGSTAQAVVGHTAPIANVAGGITPSLQSNGTPSGANYYGSAMLAHWIASDSPVLLNLAKSRSATIGSHSGGIVQDDDRLGTINFVADDGVDFISIAASIQGEIDGAPSANDTPGRLIFKTTADGAQTSTERMRITSAGDVRIGATTGNYKLSVTETGASSAGQEVFCTNASFAATNIIANTTRAANSAYSFYKGFSSNFGDTEFNLRGDGEAYADGSWNASGADYQEWFESTDGAELEVGKAVVLDGDKIRIYNADTDSADNILGITRPQADNKNSAVVGNTAWNHWTDKYLTDDWGVYIRDDVTVWEWDEVKYAEGDELPDDKAVGDVKIEAGSCYERDEAADWTPPAGAVSSTQSVRKLNPEYSVEVDDETNYTPRADRDEWNLIGLLGQVQIKANEPTNPRWIKMKDISDAVELWMIR